MRHFIVIINYTTDFAEIEPLVPEHRNHLQAAVDNGVILMSGPRIPRTGGFFIAKADSDVTIQNLIDNDPYRRAGVAEYQIVEFKPGKHQGFLADWIKD